MAYWLMKSEPDVFSFDDMVAKTKRGEPEQWHGVRNYAARNNMKAMALGDLAFFYHSNIGKEIVGIIKVIALAHPDSTADLNDKGKVVWGMRRCGSGQAPAQAGDAGHDQGDTGAGKSRTGQALAPLGLQGQRRRMGLYLQDGRALIVSSGAG
jgi:hypothetical protein